MFSYNGSLWPPVTVSRDNNHIMPMEQFAVFQNADTGRECVWQTMQLVFPFSVFLTHVTQCLLAAWTWWSFTSLNDNSTEVWWLPLVCLKLGIFYMGPEKSHMHILWHLHTYTRAQDFHSFCGNRKPDRDIVTWHELHDKMTRFGENQKFAFRFSVCYAATQLALQ